MRILKKILLSVGVSCALVSGVVIAQSTSQGVASRYSLPTPVSGTMEYGTVPGEEMQTLTFPASWNRPWQDGWLDPTNPRPAYMPNDTPLGSGPYKAILTSEPGAEDLVAYYPANLAALGDSKLPVLIWGNGSCTFNGNKYRHLLTDVASYGYFVMGGGRMNPNGGGNETTQIRSNNGLRDPMAERTPAPAQPAAAAPNPTPRTRVTVDTLSHGIDWVIAENQREGSRFFNRLDTDNIAVMGHSCGGGLAANFGSDPRVKTLGLWNATGNAELAAGITKPTLIAPGDPRFDVLYWAGNETYKVLRKTSTPVAFIWRANMTHLGTFRTENGGLESPIIRAWLDYQLKGDRQAASMFVGDDCILCNTPGWQVESRNLD